MIKISYSRGFKPWPGQDRANIVCIRFQHRYDTHQSAEWQELKHVTGEVWSLLDGHAEERGRNAAKQRDLRIDVADVSLQDEVPGWEVSFNASIHCFSSSTTPALSIGHLMKSHPTCDSTNIHLQDKSITVQNKQMKQKIWTNWLTMWVWLHMAAH